MAVPNPFRRFSSLEYFVCIILYIPYIYIYIHKCKRMHAYKHIQHGCGALRPLLHSFLGVGFRFRYLRFPGDLSTEPEVISRTASSNLGVDVTYRSWTGFLGWLAGPGRKARLKTWMKGTFLEPMGGGDHRWPGPDFKKAWPDEAQFMDAIFIGMIRMELWWWGSKLDVFFSIYI